MKPRSMRKTTSLIMILLLALTFIHVSAADKVSITVENVNATVGTEIMVPVKITNNTGVCGATISFTYPSALSLKKISRGDAFPTLTMSVTGDLKANPVRLSFDGLEEDKTNGSIAYLVFEAAYENGVYPICMDCEIINGKLKPVDAVLKSGQVIVKTDAEETSPKIKVGNVAADFDETIEVPLCLQSNPGICGMTLNIFYDDALTLLAIEPGEALQSLVITMPGDIPKNSIKLTFDGIEPDTSNGVFAILKFIAPKQKGVYDIDVHYNTGDIVNGKLKPLDVLLENGSVTVEVEQVAIIIGKETVFLPYLHDEDVVITVAFYSKHNELLAFQQYNMGSTKISVKIVPNADTAKVFCWTKLMKPQFVSQEITC